MWLLRYQEPITRSLHLPYKPLESTLSDEKLFIGIVLAQNLSRTSAYCRSEKKNGGGRGKLTNKFTPCSMTAFLYMFYPFQCIFGKACSKNNSSLERVDSKIQHIWRLRAMGSCRYTSIQACMKCSLRGRQQNTTDTAMRTPPKKGF